MKKIFAIIFLTLSLISFSACGSTYAKVTGITAGIVNFDSNEAEYRTDCIDDRTLTENDYLITTGIIYKLCVFYTFTGGSKTPIFSSAENVRLVYDDALLQIGEPSIKGELVYYPIECKSEFIYTAILIEVDEKYHTEVIVSAVAYE